VSARTKPAQTVVCDLVPTNFTSVPPPPPRAHRRDVAKIFERIERGEGFPEGVTTDDLTIISRDPWIVTIDNFVTDEQTEAVMHETKGSFLQSTDTGAKDAHGIAAKVKSTGRTSTNAWCHDECSSNPLVASIYTRIEKLTGVDVENYERLQVLNYINGQYYNEHHDASQSQYEQLAGPRVLTVFIYFSDVEEGGHTAFPKLGLSVKPKKGRVLVWPSVMAEDAMKIDYRTNHEAQPVIKGLKIAANAWVHMFNYLVPNKMGCSGSFS
jgi:prolyl 4-hydroxylase